MIYLLLVLLLVLLIIAYLFFKKDLAAPAVLFIAGFVYCASWACAYAEDWGLANMRSDTFFVILGGCLSFLLTSVSVHAVFKRIRPEEKRDVNSKKSSALPAFNIPTWFKVVACMFMAAALVASLKSVIDITNGSWSNIPVAINSYDRLTKFDSEIVKVPLYVTLARMVATALAYWFLYVFISGLFKNGKKWRRIDWLSLLVVFIDVLILLSNGGRNGVVNMLIAAIVFLIVLYYKKHAINYLLKPRWWLLAIILFVGFLFAFPKINILLGRNVAKDTNYYLAIYSGAEIKNLDIFLEQREDGSFINSGNNQTFVSINNTIIKLLHRGAPYKLDLPFRKTTTKDGRVLSLGNVYTTFYQFIYDFGFLGVAWCSALAALISQFFYEKARRVKNGMTPSIYILISGYISSSLLLSFFSNKFYEQNFNKGFIANILVWSLLYVLISKVFIGRHHGKTGGNNKMQVKEEA